MVSEKNKLVQRKADLVAAWDALHAQIDGAMTDEQRAEDDRLAADVAAVDDQLAREGRRRAALESLEARSPYAPEKATTRRLEVLDPEALTWGDFLQAVHLAGLPGGKQDDPRVGRLQAAITGQSQSVPSEGGYLVPPEFSTAIWERMSGDGMNLLSMCDSYTITGESLTLPAVKDADRSGGLVRGGLKAYWIAEADQLTATKTKLRTIRLEPQQLAVLVYATDKILQNATAMESYIARGAAEAITFAVNDSLIRGDGSGKPLGILNAPCTISVAKESGQPATTFLAENVSKMWARMHPRAKSGSEWFTNTDVGPQLDQLSFTVGASGQLVYLTSIADPNGTRLKGRPVVETDFCATLGTVGDVILANWGYYAVAVRGGVNSAMSMHIRFDYAETAFRFMFELDGQPWLESAITPYKGAGTLSTFVTLATRS